MQHKDITLEHIEHILKIYTEVCGDIHSYTSAEFIEHDLRAAEDDHNKMRVLTGGYRFGSRWTPHSKLRFNFSHDGTIKVLFDPNNYERGKGQPETEAAREEFGQRVEQYFSSLEE